jgi:hypothetical protein
MHGGQLEMPALYNRLLDSTVREDNTGHSGKALPAFM